MRIISGNNALSCAPRLPHHRHLIVCMVYCRDGVTCEVGVSSSVEGWFPSWRERERERERVECECEVFDYAFV